MRQLLRRVWYLLRQRRLEADLAEEMEFHRDMKQRELEERGAESTGAAFAARRAPGSLALAQDRSRDVWLPRWLQGVGQDLRLAVRTLRATPIVTSVAALSLALGIGANTAIFSVVNSLLLRTLPVVEPQRLVTVSSASAAKQGFTAGWTYTIWDEIRQRATAFDGAIAWSSSDFAPPFNLAEGGETQPVDGLFVSGDFFTALGVPALVGRTFTSADDVRGGGPGGPVAVISYALWQRRFGGTPDVVGRPLVVERIPVTIVGVTPPGFFGAEVGHSFDVALPIGAEPLIHGKDTKLRIDGPGFLTVMLRLKPGQILDRATATLRGVQPQIAKAALPPDPRELEEFLKDPFTLVPAAAGTSSLRQEYGRPLLTILAIVGLSLFIACANIANLLLARATARRRELSVRRALGASRWRLGRQLLVESLILATIGAAAGLVVAAWGSRALVAQLSTSITRVVLDLSLDWRVLTFTAAVTVLTALLFGVAPALRASGVAPMDALKAHGRASPEDARGLASSLVVAQVALSLLLVVAAGLFLRTLEQLARVPLGFDSERVLIVTVDATHASIEPTDRVAFYHRLVDAVGAVPGVAQAAGSISTPMNVGIRMIGIVNLPGVTPASNIFVDGRPTERSTWINIVTPGWFAAYGRTIRAGRDLDVHDTKTSPSVVVVNDTFVRRFFPDGNAIGKTFTGGTRPGERPEPITVVGVVSDAVDTTLRDEAPPTLYSPLARWDNPRPEISLSIRSSARSPELLPPSIAAALTAVNRDLSFTFRPLASQVNESLTQERTVAMLSGVFGALALLLAALGLYGVTSYAVTRRRSEIGIRMALGAEPAGVVRLVLSRVLIMTGLGIVIGAGVSVWASQFVASLLYGLEPRDPATLIGAVVLLAVVAALAGGLPAWRASRIDPAAVLRDQ